MRSWSQPNLRQSLEIRFTGVVVDGLGADQDEAREVVLERLECVEEDAAGRDVLGGDGVHVSPSTRAQLRPGRP